MRHVEKGKGKAAKKRQKAKNPMPLSSRFLSSTPAAIATLEAKQEAICSYYSALFRGVKK
jgi:hypothetical protein